MESFGHNIDQTLTASELASDTATIVANHFRELTSSGLPESIVCVLTANMHALLLNRMAQSLEVADYEAQMYECNATVDIEE